jgi:hypothetical protein
MTPIQKAVAALKKQHKTWRAAGKATGINYAYLYRLHKGTKTNPNGEVLAKLGFEKRVTYRSLS